MPLDRERVHLKLKALPDLEDAVAEDLRLIAGVGDGALAVDSSIRRGELRVPLQRLIEPVEPEGAGGLDSSSVAVRVLRQAREASIDQGSGDREVLGNQVPHDRLGVGASNLVVVRARRHARPLFGVGVDEALGEHHVVAAAGDREDRVAGGRIHRPGVRQMGPEKNSRSSR